MLPPWPGWENLHPLVVHFPIALLLTAPVFVLLALVQPKRGGAFGVSALVLLVLGTAAAFLAAETGEAAEQVASHTRMVGEAIESHASLAETARNLFAGLTAAYAVILAIPVLVKRLASRTWVVVTNAIVLGLLLAAGLVLANAAHRGGLLVHTYGVHATLKPGS